jgi:hypothetical protein
VQNWKFSCLIIRTKVRKSEVFMLLDSRCPVIKSSYSFGSGVFADSVNG